jgi:hypothetical protein
MNERIEAYLKQHYCRDYFNRYGEMVEDDYYFMYREEVDGLIELIVRECVNRVRSRQQFATEDNQNVTQAFDLLVYDIESHFGVEP